jgi:hypothetical protein
MRYGKTVHVSKLLVGDVVRPVRGPQFPTVTPAGGPDDFREGYDAMVVVYQDEEYLTFHRPHIEIYSDEMRVTHVNVSVEIVNMVSRTGGHWYEVLAYGQHHKDAKTGKDESHWAGERR